MDQTKSAELSHSQIPPSGIPGWGADMAKERRVGIPREGDFTPEENGAHWDQPEEQISNVKIFLSSERKAMTPVFGTTCPPKGLSGKIREFAYGIHENKRAHWMTLMLADRIDVIESMLTNAVFIPAQEGKTRKVSPSFLAAIGIGALAGIYFFGMQKKGRKVTGSGVSQRRRKGSVVSHEANA